jgi:hypothetical protein
MGRNSTRRLRRALPLVLPMVLIAGVAPAVAADAQAPAHPAHAVRAAAVQICHSTAHPYIAKKLSADIVKSLRSRRSYAAIGVYDRKKHLTCQWRQRRHFDSASIVKATIISAFLRKTHGKITKSQRSLAWKMITKSDNNAASALWRTTGRASLNGFLHAAGMTSTKLGSGGYWGLTQVTANNELTLLRLLTRDNKVIGPKSRRYVQYLMKNVTKSQRWGTPAGAPRGVAVHVKNGWLSRSTHGWRINSLGTFNGSGHDYMIDVLSYDNPSMSYGVTTVERVSRLVHRDLNPGAKTAVKMSQPNQITNGSDGSAPFRVGGE